MHYDPNIDYKNEVYLGPLDKICKYCYALKWKDESLSMCCQQGKVKLAEIIAPPEPLLSLLSGQHPNSKHFLKNIRKYNNAFQMT